MPAFYKRWFYRAKLTLIGKLLGKPQPKPMTFVGPGASAQLSKAISQFGIKKLLIVTDKPLRELGVALDQLTVETSTWGDWKAAHPATRIVAEDGGIGRTYSEDPLRGRDDDGPIFPIGDVDPRLPVQESVIGVVHDDGTPVAFRAATAREALDAGDVVTLNGIEITSDGGGFVARDAEDGEPIATHQAFWFAWSQFHPATLLWDGA